MYQTLVDAATLAAHLDDPDWAVFDCRFHLVDKERGEAAYLQAHLPGAVYVHLERDLSAPVTGRNGRHPLPSQEAMEALLSRLGVHAGLQVVAYDEAGGPYAARLWWMLRYLGHEAVAVLDGGWPAWQEAELPTRDGRESRGPATFQARPRQDLRCEADEILASLGAPSLVLLDSRAPERYRGETEPYDPVAGRIPGARNRFWKENLDPQGRFLPPETLRAAFEAVLGAVPLTQVVVYCGSGVTACHNLLAMAHAGLEGARLYPGSRSEWCADPARPVARDKA